MWAAREWDSYVDQHRHPKFGLFTSQTTRLAVLRVVFHLTCSEFIAGSEIKNMGFLSGGDDLKRSTQCNTTPESRTSGTGLLHSPGGATNWRKFMQIYVGNNNSSWFTS